MRRYMRRNMPDIRRVTYRVYTSHVIKHAYDVKLTTNSLYYNKGSNNFVGVSNCFPLTNKCDVKCQSQYVAMCQKDFGHSVNKAVCMHQQQSN